MIQGLTGSMQVPDSKGIFEPRGFIDKAELSKHAKHLLELRAESHVENLRK